MITRSATIRQTPLWQRQLAGAITDLDALCLALDLDPVLLSQADPGRDFPLRVPQPFVERMQKGNPDDPLLLQVIPQAREMLDVPGYNRDPVGDRQAMVAPGLLHKYHGRVLMTMTGACAIHCRYCFRRHYPYPLANPAAREWSEALDYLAEHREVHELILSGGDPLSLSDTRLARFVNKLNDINTVKTLRIHTRLPVVIPERICEDLLAWVHGSRLQVVFVIHCNHAQEIDADVRAALDRLRQAGVTLLNQSVLLRGINDSVDILESLSHALFAAGVLPYYLHALDPVAGAAHFDLSEENARAIHCALQARLPGYLVPRLVREIPGASSKQSLFR